MRILFVFFALLMSFSSYSQINKTDSQGRKQGEWQKAYPNSRILVYRGQFKDDKPVGKFVYYYNNGKVKAIIIHEENSNRSEAYYYDENKRLMSYGIYRDMKRDSVWTSYTPMGDVSQRESYKQDSLDGKKIVYFIPENDRAPKGMVASEFTFVNGTLNGEYKEFFNDGTPRAKGNYLNGRRHGVWEEFHTNGKRSSLLRYKNGKIHGWAIAYDENMKRIGKVYYYYGQVMEGEQLEKLLELLEERGINPNE